MTNWSQVEDPFAFISTKAGTIPSAQWRQILYSPFLNDHVSPAASGGDRCPRSPAMTQSVTEPYLGLGFGSDARILPSTVGDPIKEEKGQDSSGKTGSCSVNPPVKQSTAEKARSFCENPNNTSETAGSCNANVKDLSEKIGTFRVNQSVKTENVLPESEKMIGEMDILEIASMKGIRFGPPRWHGTGGYDPKTCYVHPECVQ